MCGGGTCTTLLGPVARGGAEAPLGPQVPLWLQPWVRVLERGVSVAPCPGLTMTLLPTPRAELKLSAVQCEEPQDELTELQGVL